MLTLVKTFSGANFGNNSIGVIDPEPRIAVPAGTLAEVRLGRSLPLTLRNRVTEGPTPYLYPDPASGYTVSENSFVAVPTGTVLLPVTMAVPCTIIAVYKQGAAAPAVSACLGGAPRTSADGVGLLLTASGNIAASSRRSGTSTNAGFATAGGARYEFVAAVFDKPGQQLRLERPRTATVQSTTLATANWPATTSLYRVLGNNNSDVSGAAEGVLNILVPFAMSSAEIAALYASARESLDVSGIEI